MGAESFLGSPKGGNLMEKKACCRKRQKSGGAEAKILCAVCGNILGRRVVDGAVYWSVVGNLRFEKGMSNCCKQAAFSAGKNTYNSCIPGCGKQVELATGADGQKTWQMRICKVNPEWRGGQVIPYDHELRTG